MKKLKINRSVYSDESIEKTRTAFRDHAITLIAYKQQYAIVTFLKCKYDEAQTIKEFENYMIGAENL